MKAKHERYTIHIATAVKRLKTAAGGVYTTDIIKATGLDRQVIVNWLKSRGFEKRGGPKSHYWQKVPA